MRDGEPLKGFSLEEQCWNVCFQKAPGFYGHCSRLGSGSGSGDRSHEVADQGFLLRLLKGCSDALPGEPVCCLMVETTMQLRVFLL